MNNIDHHPLTGKCAFVNRICRQFVMTPFEEYKHIETTLAKCVVMMTESVTKLAAKQQAIIAEAIQDYMNPQLPYQGELDGSVTVGKIVVKWNIYYLNYTFTDISHNPNFDMQQTRLIYVRLNSESPVIE